MKESAGKVLMLVENHFPSDVRVRNESALLRQEGYDVTVICLKRKGEQITEVVHGIRVYRIPKLEFFQKAPQEGQTLLQRQSTRCTPSSADFVPNNVLSRKASKTGRHNRCVRRRWDLRIDSFSFFKDYADAIYRSSFGSNNYAWLSYQHQLGLHFTDVLQPPNSPVVLA